MRLAMFKPARERTSDWRVGAALDDCILDLAAAAAAYAREHPTNESHAGVPSNILDLLRRGDNALAGIRRVHDWARQERVHASHASIVSRRDECLFDAPLRPGKLITLARNYHEHVAE